MQTHWLIRIFLASLRLFPAAYREKYGEELAYAIRASVAEARARGPSALAKLAWRELRDLPGALVAAHLAALAGCAMYANHARPKWFFYPAWVLASAISLPVAWAITSAVIQQVVKVVGGTIWVEGYRHITEDYLAAWILFPAVGLASGSLQFLALRRYVARAGWWVAATALGWAASSVLLRFIFESARVGAGLSPAVAGVALGGWVALPQWWMLRRRVRRAGWWPVANALGWGMVGLVTGPAISDWLDVALAALIPAAATAILLWLLLDRLPRRDAGAAQLGA